MRKLHMYRSETQEPISELNLKTLINDQFFFLNPHINIAMSILVSLFPLLESQVTYLPDSKVPLFVSWWKSMSNGVQELVPDCHCRTLICKRAFARWFCFDRRGLKQTSVQGGTKPSGRNTNLEAVGKVLRTQPSDIQETGGEEFVDDSPTDRKPS